MAIAQWVRNSSAARMLTNTASASLDTLKQTTKSNPGSGIPPGEPVKNISACSVCFTRLLAKFPSFLQPWRSLARLSWESSVLSHGRTCSTKASLKVMQVFGLINLTTHPAAATSNGTFTSGLLEEKHQRQEQEQQQEQLQDEGQWSAATGQIANAARRELESLLRP